jgi:DNA-binding NarL/FixJ family response regulator
VRQRLRGWLGESTRVELGEAVRACEVLERLHAEAADLVLLDLHLGSTLGFELIGRIKSLLPRALVLVLSNAASELHRRECLRRGADYFFDKSLEFERALELVACRAATHL